MKSNLDAPNFNFVRFLILLTLLASLLSISVIANADTINELLGGKIKKAEQETATKVISTENTRVSDRKIRNRLGEIYRELETLNKVRIDVNKSVVTLTGEVNSASVQEKAISLAKKVEGVVEVKNEIVVTRSVEKRLETTWNKISKLGIQVFNSLPVFLLALTVFVLAWFLGSWVSNRQSLFRRISKNAFIANLLGQIAHLIFIVLGLVLALSLLDATALLGTIMGAAGIVGLAIGFAVRDTVENYIASILLSLRNPFQMNDYVNIDGNEGNVARLTSRATILITSDGNHVRIPNSQVFKAVITNFTRNSQRRFSFDLGIDAAQDLNEAQNLAIDTLENIEGVLRDPKPMALIQNLGDFNVILRVYGWVDQEHYSFGKVRSEAIKKVKAVFDEAEIVMPEPIYQIRMPEPLDASKNKKTDTQQLLKKTAAKKKTSTKTKSTEETDLKPDDTVIEQIEEEQTADNENLLSPETPIE